MRPDLAALTTEAVTALSNVGLVKRSAREAEQGKGPTLAEAADGTVTGTFPDGVTVTWPVGVGLRDSSCSCGAREVCRHRVAVALGYRGWSAGVATTVGADADATNAPTETAPQAATTPLLAQPPGTPNQTIPSSIWSPAELDDVALKQYLGARMIDAAKAARSRGVLARVRPASAADPIPSVALPSCTVRFLAPRALAFARCDCRLGERCPHIALAVWAFRAATQTGVALAAEQTIEVRNAVADAIDPALLAPARELGAWLLRRGVTDVAATAEVFAQRAAAVSSDLRERGYVWLLTLIEELSATVSAYKTRSAGYRASELVETLAGIEARCRAALSSTCELPASFVLGRDTPFETRLDHVRLTSLGARLRARGTTAEVRVLLANLDTGDVLALDRSYDADPTGPGGAQLPTAASLATRRLASTTLQALATGHIVTQAAVRRANDELLIRSNLRGTSSVTPQNGDFAMLSGSRRFNAFAALSDHLRTRPPSMLRPRRLGEDTFVVEVAKVERVGFDAAEQTIFASLLDREGDRLWLVRRYDACAPRAIEAIGAALKGHWGALRWVGGELELGPSGLTMDPTILSTDRVVVPDLELGAPALDVPRARAMHEVPPWRNTMDDVMERLVEAAHIGLDNLGGTYGVRLSRSIEATRTAGFDSVPARLQGLLESLGPDRSEARADRWFDAMLRLRLVLEQP